MVQLAISVEFSSLKTLIMPINEHFSITRNICLQCKMQLKQHLISRNSLALKVISRMYLLPIPNRLKHLPFHFSRDIGCVGRTWQRHPMQHPKTLFYTSCETEEHLRKLSLFCSLLCSPAEILPCQGIVNSQMSMTLKHIKM